MPALRSRSRDRSQLGHDPCLAFGSRKQLSASISVRNVQVEGLQLDPNRMFSRVGAEANLKRLNPAADVRQAGRALDLLDRGLRS